MLLFKVNQDNKISFTTTKTCQKITCLKEITKLSNNTNIKNYCLIKDMGILLLSYHKQGEIQKITV